MTVKSIKNTIIEGDTMKPSDFDMIAQVGYLDVGLPVPEGWNVLTGNQRESKVARVVLRHEIGE